MSARLSAALVALAAASLAGCPSPPPAEIVEDTTGDETEVTVVAETPREPPPAPGEARDVHLPPITRTRTTSGLAIDAVRYDALPLVYVRFTVRSGLASDPPTIPGLSHLVAEMLKEGTRRRTSAQLAEEIEYLGAHLDVFDDESTITIQLRGLSEHTDAMIALLAEMVREPRFDERELRRLRQREIDRLRLEAGDPATVARREMYRFLYGPHPYAHVDATPEGVRRAQRRDIQAWHRDHFVPNNSFLVVVGDVASDAVTASAERAFRGWRERPVDAPAFPELAPRTAREVVIVHRPGSAQSVIAVGNLAIPRGHADWVPLAVANQVLGGSAASRLFMDLRERRSLTYGAYSGVDELPLVGPFRARAAVGRDPREPTVDRTGLAMDGFMEHLDRIVRDAAPEAEVDAARRYLSDRFPLQIDTAGRIAWMVANLRLYGLPDDYWDTYRTEIRAVTPAQALAAAQRHIHPETALVVVVGDAEVLAEPMRRWGAVRVVDQEGAPISSFAPAATGTPP